MTKLVHTIKQFTAFINKEISEDDLNEHMKVYGDNAILRRSVFHQTAIDDHPELLTALKNLLSRLRIGPGKWAHYVGRKYSLYDVLIKIKNIHRHQTDLEIDLFIDLIENKTGFLTRSAVFYTILSLLVITFLVAFFPPALMIFHYLTNPAQGLPYLGFLFTTITTSYDFVSNLFEKKKSIFERIYDAVFLGANFVLNSSAYILWIIAAAPMTPMIVGLFVAASAVNVVKEVFYAYQIYSVYKQRPIMNANYSVEERQISMRLECSYIKHRNAAILNFIASLVLLGLMTAWCLAPGGAPVVVGIVAVIIAVHLVKNFLHKWNEVKTRGKLARELIQLDLETNTPINSVNDLEFIDSPARQAKNLVVEKKPQAVASEKKLSWMEYFGFFGTVTAEPENFTSVNEESVGWVIV